jgi:Schitoviridae HNH endonuclease
MNMIRLQQRVLMYASKNADNGCWEWTGQLSNSGYGRLKIRDRHGDVCMQSAVHVSYEAFIWPVVDGMLVMQACKNRLCVNPEHLAVCDPTGR